MKFIKSSLSEKFLNFFLIKKDIQFCTVLCYCVNMIAFTNTMSELCTVYTQNRV